MIFNKLYFSCNQLIIPVDISKKDYNRVIRRIRFIKIII